MGNLISFPIETNRQPRQDSSQPSPAPSMPSIAPASCSSRSSTNAVQEVSAGGIWLPHYEMMIVDDDPHFLDVGLLKKAALANGFQLRTTWCYSVPEALAKVEIVNPVFILHDLGKVFDQFTGDISDPAGGVAGILAQMSLNRKRKIGVASKLWEPRVVHPLLELGVSYFDKPSIRPDTMNEFALCIKLILKGGRYVSPAASAADEPSQLQPSDHRELKLIPLMQGRNLTEFDGRRVARMARDHMRTGMEQFLAGTIYAQPRLFTTGVPAAPEAEVCLVATDAEQITVVGAHLKQQAPVNSLTNRQLEVLELVRQGHSSREVAHCLSLSPAAVERRLAGARKKLNLRGAPAAQVALKALGGGEPTVSNLTVVPLRRSDGPRQPYPAGGSPLAAA